MFKFDFALDDVDADVDPAFAIDAHSALPSVSSNKNNPEPANEQPLTELPLEDLLERLPTVISYSPLTVPVLSSGEQLTLVRRDLFDARFQLIAHAEEGDGGGGGEGALAFVEAPSDLVPGVYEGGLKTWECAVDLAGYLAGKVGDVRGKRVLEIGCGTGVPTMSVLREVFARLPTKGKGETHIHLQDYNASVLDLVAFPNLLLTWYMSPAAAPFRTSAHSTSASLSSGTTTAAPPPPDPAVPGELPLTPLLKSAFLTALKVYGVRLRFFAGPWGAFGTGAGLGEYEVVLTSETIYRRESLGALLRVLRAAAGLGEEGRRGGEHMCLMAAKVVYFGVGGGVSEFAEAVRTAGGTVESVWEGGVGVGRRIIRVRWGQAELD